MRPCFKEDQLTDSEGTQLTETTNRCSLRAAGCATLWHIHPCRRHILQSVAHTGPLTTELRQSARSLSSHLLFPLGYMRLTVANVVLSRCSPTNEQNVWVADKIRTVWRQVTERRDRNSPL